MSSSGRRHGDFVRASLLDRIGARDHATSTPPGGLPLREIEQTIRRDLERLLNTRWRCVAPPEELDELSCSLVNYGIPDFTGKSMGTRRRQQELGRIIGRVIELYEPRLSAVRVQLIDDSSRDRVLRFRIRAKLTVSPVDQGVEYTSSFEPVTASIRVRGMGG